MKCVYKYAKFINIPSVLSFISWTEQFHIVLAFIHSFAVIHHLGISLYWVLVFMIVKIQFNEAFVWKFSHRHLWNKL